MEKHKGIGILGVWSKAFYGEERGFTWSFWFEQMAESGRGSGLEIGGKNAGAVYDRMEDLHILLYV
jgi:hypothetical protein